MKWPVLVLASAAALHAPPLARRSPLRSRPAVRLCAEEGGTADELDGADAPDGADDLNAMFQQRLEDEGGATKFKLRTDAERAANTFNSGVESAVNVAKDSADRLINVGTESQGGGILDNNSWKLTLGFFAATVLLAFGSALFGGAPSESNYTAEYGMQSQRSGSKVDMYTSDGQELQFGRRI